MGFIFAWWEVLKAVGCDACIEAMRERKDAHGRAIRAMAAEYEDAPPVGHRDAIREAMGDDEGGE